MAEKSAQRSSFGVELTGLSLPAKTAARVSRAVQRAVLAELADLDIAPAYAVRLEPLDEADPGRRGQTNGIWVEVGEELT